MAHRATVTSVTTKRKRRAALVLTMIGGSSNVSVRFGLIVGPAQLRQRCCGRVPWPKWSTGFTSTCAAIMCQLTHMGRRNVSNDGDWLPTIAPSPVREPMHRFWPKQMQSFRTCEGCRSRLLRGHPSSGVDAGLDGIELLATSHLLGSVLVTAGELSYRRVRRVFRQPTSTDHGSSRSSPDSG